MMTRRSLLKYQCSVCIGHHWAMVVSTLCAVLGGGLGPGRGSECSGVAEVLRFVL